MNRVAYDVNTFWFYAVFLHILGSILFSVVGIVPNGIYICLVILWGLFYYFSKRDTKSLIGTLAGCLITIFIFANMPIGYQTAFLMNSLMFLLVYYVCRQREEGIAQCCHIRKIPIRQWGWLFLLVILFLIIAIYINAVSMLFVDNKISDSLTNAKEYFLPSIIVYVILPAIIEEMMFRGCIYQGIQQKKIAVIVSAVLFALLHMNWNQMSYAFVMGILFALLILVTDNLSTSIIIHLLFNFYNILVSAFPNHRWVTALQGFCIGEYSIFAPTLIKETGEKNGIAIAEGALMVIIAMLIFLCVLRILKKEGEKDSKDSTGIRWKPNRAFWIGCIACIAIAISYEILL